MQVEELQHSAIFQALKKDKKAQQAVVKLQRLEEWKTLKRFVTELKQTLLEATLEVDSLKEIQRYKFLIRGIESVVLLPKLVDLVKELKDEDNSRKEKEELDAKRRKYAPGTFVKNIVEKFKK